MPDLLKVMKIMIIKDIDTLLVLIYQVLFQSIFEVFSYCYVKYLYSKPCDVI